MFTNASQRKCLTSKMNRITVPLFIILMFLRAEIPAQKNIAPTFQWKTVAAIPASAGQARALGLAGLIAGVHHNVLLVAGGSNFPDATPWDGGKKKYYDDVFVLQQSAAGKYRWNNQQFKLKQSIAYASVVATGKGIVCIGGENESGILNNVFLLKWDVVKKKMVTEDLPPLPVPLTNASATTDGKLIYVAGGETVNAVSNKFYVLDMEKASSNWKELPVIPKPVSHAVLVIQSNGHNKNIYLLGGRKKNSNGISELYNSVFEFDILKNQWIKKKSLPYVLSAGTAVATGSTKIILFGGDKGETFHKTEELIAAINTEQGADKREDLIKKKNVLQASHPGFSKEVLIYDTEKNEWDRDGILPFATPVTSIAFMWNEKVVIAGGEIKAGVRTAGIQMGTMVATKYPKKTQHKTH